MGRDLLVRKINQAYKEAGRQDDWTLRNFHSLYELNSLAHFQIFDLHWFPGAGLILELVDRLHTVMTPKEDFIEMAIMLDIQINPNGRKQTIAELVKANSNWRVKAFDLERKKKQEARTKELQPIFEYLTANGYHTTEHPVLQGNDKWSINVQDAAGTWDTVYFIERGRDVYVDTLYKGRLGVIEGKATLFTKRI